MLALIAAALLAGSPEAAADSNPDAGGAKPDKIVCKSFPKSDTRIGVNRVCKPRSEWEYVQREQELELDQLKIDNTMMQPVTPPSMGLRVPARHPN